MFRSNYGNYSDYKSLYYSNYPSLTYPDYSNPYPPQSGLYTDQGYTIYSAVAGASEDSERFNAVAKKLSVCLSVEDLNESSIGTHV